MDSADDGNKSDATEEESVPLPLKQVKIDSFESAFSDLKNSEFFNKELPGKGQSSVVIPKTSSSALLVNLKQKGNPLLKYIRNIRWEHADIIPDFIMSSNVCALFLSIRYHQLNPDYIHDRLKLLGSGYNLRVLVVQIDVPEPQHALKHLTRISILADLTMIPAWNPEDAADIIEIYKVIENTPADKLMDDSDTNNREMVMSALTEIQSISNTDAMTLMASYGSIARLMKASVHSLSFCPGFGLEKAKRLHKVLHEPFLCDTDIILAKEYTN